MSSCGLNKITSRIQRGDTIADLTRINNWLSNKSERPISAYDNTVRALENSVALGIEKVDKTGMPNLVRGLSFYESCLPEIKDSERKKFELINKTTPQ